LFSAQGYDWYKVDADFDLLARCCDDCRLFPGDAFPGASQAR
jgi:hypothetical protein